MIVYTNQQFIKINLYQNNPVKKILIIKIKFNKLKIKFKKVKILLNLSN